MRDIESEPQMAATIGIPEFFVTDVGLVESAGGGNVRVIRCIKRGNVLLPVFSLITPLPNMIAHAKMVRLAAQQMFGDEMSGMTALQHH